MTAHIQAIGLAGLRHQVADVEPGGLAAFDGAHQFWHQQIGEQGCVKAARSEHDQVGIGDRFECPWQGRRSFRTAAQANNGAGGVADVAFAFDPLAVFKFGPELHIHVGGGHHLTLHGQHTT